VTPGSPSVQPFFTRPIGIATYNDPIGLPLTPRYEGRPGADRRPAYTDDLGAQP
jgi:hypothetical protein